MHFKFIAVPIAKSGKKQAKKVDFSTFFDPNNRDVFNISEGLKILGCAVSRTSKKNLDFLYPAIPYGSKDEQCAILKLILEIDTAIPEELTQLIGTYTQHKNIGHALSELETLAKNPNFNPEKTDVLASHKVVIVLISLALSASEDATPKKACALFNILLEKNPRRIESWTPLLSDEALKTLASKVHANTTSVEFSCLSRLIKGSWGAAKRILNLDIDTLLLLDDISKIPQAAAPKTTLLQKCLEVVLNAEDSRSHDLHPFFERLIGQDKERALSLLTGIKQKNATLHEVVSTLVTHKKLTPVEGHAVTGSTTGPSSKRARLDE